MRQHTQVAALGGHLLHLEEATEIAIKLETDNTAITAGEGQPIWELATGSRVGYGHQARTEGGVERKSTISTRGRRRGSAG